MDSITEMINEWDWNRVYRYIMSLEKEIKRLTEPNPLSLDELKERGGKPVYIVEHPKWGHWELSEYAEDYFEDRDTDFYGMNHNDPDGRYGLHVLGWLAFDREPKGARG